ncbi:phosphodiester glycosidase family protein [Anthocerotibacter panamensis]|uniref:phosphodiester glycosidase family protein n=1 Tax=Anthocerotibacter panamensis TaxID=2857077 RepID=UPI001C4083EA|nr:phosphodiester glycosidase family protein [Anthocerotibacter panamensis]
MVLTRRQYLQAQLILGAAGVGVLLDRRADAYTLDLPNAPWLVPGTEVSIPDWWLAENLGVELLSGTDPDTQRLRWFGAPLVLPVRPGPAALPGRYLSLEDLKKALGLHGAGVSLEIPAGQVTSLKTNAQGLVVVLDRPVPWQFQQQAARALLRLAAQFENIRPPRAPAPPFQKITLLKGEVQGQVALDLKGNAPALVRTYSNPYRLVLDFTPRAAGSSGPTYTQTWRPGLTYQRWDFWANATQRVHVLTMDPARYSWQLLRAPGKQSLPEFARSTQALAAINGGFFNINTALPLGAVRIQGQWQAGPILQRGAVAWDSSTMQFDRLDWQGILESPQARLLLVGWNSGFIRAGLSVYTRAWGERYTTLSDQETIVTVQDDTTQLPLQLTVRGAPLLIPEGGYLLVGRAYGEALLQQQFKNSTPVALNLSLSLPTWQTLPNILGGGPLLLKNGVRVLDADLEKFQADVKLSQTSRTAVGRTGDGQMVWVVAEGRLAQAQGLTLEGLAAFLERLGCVDALNLDGGGSSGFYLGGALRSQPTNASRLLSTALVIADMPSLVPDGVKG